MTNRDHLGPVGGLLAGCELVDGLEHLGAVVPPAATVADPDGDALEDDEAGPPLEELAVDPLHLDRPAAVIASESVHGLQSSPIRRP